jgi:hypothetical protein
LRNFDRKLGSDFLSKVPREPGVYLVFDGSGLLIYVGKAKNLRRRLAQYRNAKRAKRHHKMRSIIKGADRIEYRLCPTEAEACLLETELIQAHRPKWNVAGAFHFLYPLIGIRREGRNVLFCYTTRPGEFPAYEFHGAFRSRHITSKSFFSLMKLLPFIAHPMARGDLPKRKKYCYVFGFRELDLAWVDRMEELLRGESRAALEDLSLALLERPGARNSSEEVQEHLQNILRFWKQEALTLADARKRTGYSQYPVPQNERDFIFLRKRFSLQHSTALPEASP